MIDMNPEAADLLKEICTVQPAFPQIDSAFPYVSLTEIGNSSAAVLNGEERYSRYECQIDVWDSAAGQRRNDHRRLFPRRRKAHERSFRAAPVHDVIHRLG